uniref:Uncharacterized protein n=1 Tax=Strombidium rassoulzadegani TaxID=1082188 RepID=A0A7S3CJJ3_9SPIT|mmetsp:Transcript_13279/g.22536  ORF Transcript_13279/g.22536 Transcript_13279/m.22536 type:complete len:154 (+) Transcript_13279:258-719(+)
MKTSEELNQQPHPMFEMGSRRHYEARMSETYKFKSHLKIVGPRPRVEVPAEEIKITEIPIPIKPKEDRNINDLNKLHLQKYNGVKQIAAKLQVAEKRVEERQKRTFTDTGISIMTIGGQKVFTMNNAQSFKEQMNADKAARLAYKKKFNEINA